MMNILYIVIAFYIGMMIGGILIYQEKKQSIDWAIFLFGIFILPISFFRISVSMHKEITQKVHVSFFSYANLILILFLYVELFPLFFNLFVSFLIEIQQEMKKKIIMQELENSQSVRKYKKEQEDIYRNALTA